MMGDRGNSSASGGSSLSSSALNSLFSDASLGDQMTGGSGDIFGGSSSADLSNLFADAGLGSALLGDSSGLGGLFSTIDPSGTAAATQSMTPQADVAGTPAGSDPSSNIGGTQSGGAPQPTQPARPVTPTPQPQAQSPLATLAKAIRSSFGLGALPAAGGPTGFTALPAGAAAAEGAGLGAAAAPLAGAGFLLPFMTQPLQPATGVEAPRTLGRSPSGPPDPTRQPARPVTPTPQPAAQPPADPAQPAPAPAPAPAAPAASAPATADLPTRKEPDTPEAAPEPPEGVYGPTGGEGGIGGILRDVLGLTLANPIALPILAMALSGLAGGRRRGGGIPPWAMHGMMPFMRGTNRGFVGFRGGFLRPGYYPMRQGGWGFHPGGYHPGWGDWAPRVIGNQPMAFAAGAAGAAAANEAGGWRGANVQSGGVPYQGAGTPVSQSGGEASEDDIMATIRQRESGGRNIPPWEGHDASGIYQIKPATWAAWARDSGDTEAQQYSEAWRAPPEVQTRLARWALRKYGANAAYTWKASGPDLGKPYPSIAKGSGAAPTTASAAPGYRIRDSNPDPLTSHAYPAPTETGGAPPPVQSDDFASAG